MNKDDIRKTIELFKEKSLFEIRIIEGKNNTSGYFYDVEKAIEELENTRLGKSGNIYFSLNEVNDACSNRKQWNKFIEYSQDTTSDNDILAYNWLMIDIDPKKPKGTASTNEQLKKAKEKALKIFNYMKNNSWYEPIVAMSGNGYHLMYKIALKNEKEKKELVKKCLTSLDNMFSDEDSDIDTSTFNPARICKLYGTYSRKGNNSEDRPHRLSKIVYTPKEIKTTGLTIVKKLAEKFDNQEILKKSNDYKYEKFDLQEFMNKHNIIVHSTSSVTGATRYELEECPFNSSHGCKESAIYENSNGAIAFNCFHNSCSDKKWQDLRLMYEPEAYNRDNRNDYAKPNYLKKQEETKITEKEVNTQSMFKKFSEIAIESKNRPPKEYIKTGIAEIDKKVSGLAKGEVTLISGLRASGKSSIIGQIAIESAQQGFRTVLYSGELTSTRVRNWIQLQSAGRDYTIQKDNYYVIDKKIEPLIDKWLDDKLFVYDNNKGNNFELLRISIEKAIKELKVDLIILDNLMSLDISYLAKEKYEQQSQFVGQLEKLAKDTNTHIIFVAHPRKSNGFLRLEDVSGSNDIVNRVDNAFIIHRVNKDFENMSREMYKGDLDTTIYLADNVIEICKDRENGTQDFFVPLYFDRTCKRLCNFKGENKLYNWLLETKKENF